MKAIDLAAAETFITTHARLIDRAVRVLLTDRP